MSTLGNHIAVGFQKESSLVQFGVDPLLCGSTIGRLAIVAYDSTGTQDAIAGGMLLSLVKTEAHHTLGF
jgi:hypothetical protein